MIKIIAWLLLSVSFVLLGLVITKHIPVWVGIVSLFCSMAAVSAHQKFNQGQKVSCNDQ